MRDDLNKRSHAWAVILLAALSFAGAKQLLAHDITLQPVDTAGLEPVGSEWRTENPYRGNELAVKIGASGYNQNCARCHGLEVISGGIAPDLRALEKNQDGDKWFLNRIRHGAKTNGDTKMPAFEGLLSQEAMWAIRTYIESRSPE